MAKTTPTTPAYVRKYLPLAILIIVMAVAFQQGWHRYLSLQHIAENRETLRGFVDANFLKAILIFIGIYVASIALSLPGGALLTITGGFLFGWLLGGGMTVFAATLGAAIVFLIAKTSLGETMQGRAGPMLARISKGFREDGFSYLLFLRLVPVFPFWLVNLAPALLGVPMSTFIVSTFIGIIPGTFAFAFFGAGLDSIIDAQQKAYQACLTAKAALADGGTCEFKLDPASLLTKEIVIALVALGVVALIPVIWKRRPNKGGGTPA